MTEENIYDDCNWKNRTPKQRLKDLLNKRISAFEMEEIKRETTIKQASQHENCSGDLILP